MVAPTWKHAPPHTPTAEVAGAASYPSAHPVRYNSIDEAAIRGATGDENSSDNGRFQQAQQVQQVLIALAELAMMRS